MTVSFIFGSAIPMMIVLGMIGLFLRYQIHKYMLLNFYKRPISLDHRLAKITYIVFPVIIFFHTISSIWFLGY